MAVGTLLPMTTNAQSDSFFRGGNDNYENRGGINDETGSGITNDGFGAPVGSGLLILTIAGAGYAMAKRRRSNTLILALMLMLGTHPLFSGFFFRTNEWQN